MNQDSEETAGPSAPDYTIDVFRPEDAEGIVRLCRSVGSPLRLFDDPGAIREASRKGRYAAIVARTAAGEVIGLNQLAPSATHTSLYEAGAGLVLKEYRDSGVSESLRDFLYETFMPGRPGIEEVFTETACGHSDARKAVHASKHIETALQIARMPAAASDPKESAAGRVAVLTAFRCYRPKPHRVVLPAAYEKTLRWIYERLDDTRYLDISPERIPRYAETLAEMTLLEDEGVARLAVQGIGEDFRGYLADLEEEARQKNAVVFQVWLRATTPWLSPAVDILRGMGYFFGGPLPRWFDGDGLLMQKLNCPPNFDRIVPDTDFSKELLEVIREDWKRVQVP